MQKEIYRTRKKTKEREKKKLREMTTQIQTKKNKAPTAENERS